MDPNTLIVKSKNLIYWNSGGKLATDTSVPQIAAHAKYKYIPATIQKSGEGIAVKGATDSQHNAYYIQFEDDKACMAKIDGSCNMLVSSGFSGCIFQLWKDSDSNITGAHVYKGQKGSADITTSAKSKGWSLLYSWDSKGSIKKLGQEAFVVAFVSDKAIDTVILLVESGKNVKLINWETTAYTK